MNFSGKLRVYRSELFTSMICLTSTYFTTGPYYSGKYGAFACLLITAIGSGVYALFSALIKTDKIGDYGWEKYLPKECYDCEVKQKEISMLRQALLTENIGD